MRRTWTLGSSGSFTNHVSEEYDPIHPPDAITTHLPKEKQCVAESLTTQQATECTPSLGPVDPDTVRKVVKEITVEEKARQERFNNRPPLSECLNLHDFEVRWLPIVSASHF